MGQTISSTTRTEQPITVAPLQNNTHLTVEDVTHSPSPTTEALRVQPNLDHSNSSSSTPSPSRISSNYELIDLTPTLSRTHSRQSIAVIDTPTTATIPPHEPSSARNPDVTESAPSAAASNPTNLLTDEFQSSQVDYECKYSHDALPTVAAEEEEKYSEGYSDTLVQPSYSSWHYNCIAPDHPGLPCYDEELDDMLDEYFQVDTYEREYRDDFDDFPLRQRHRSKLPTKFQFGRRITIKSRITRKQRKHEKALVGQQIRTFKEKHKEELHTQTTLAPIIHHHSENSNPQHVPFPDRMSNYHDIQVYMISRYSNELMRHFHTGPTEIISIASATREGPTDDELYFNPDECELIPMLHPTLHCEMSYEGHIQQYGMTFSERLKLLPAAARAKLHPHDLSFQPHTAEQCQTSCQKKATEHGYSLTDGGVRQLLKDCSTPTWITISNESGQPRQISSDIHTLHFRVEQVGPNYTYPLSWNILMMEVTYRVNRLQHYKNSPCRQPELKLLARDLSRHQQLAFAVKRRHKCQARIRQEKVNYAPRFSQQPYSTYERGLAPSYYPIDEVDDGESEDTVDDVCSFCGEEIWNVGVRHVCWYRRDLEEYYLDKWRRLQEKMRREDEDNWRIEVYERDVVRVKVQPPPRTTSCVNQVPRYDAFGTRTNIGPTQANRTIITYDTISTQPTRTRHRQQLGVPRGGKKTRKEMKGLKLLYNQKRNEMTQEMESKPAPTLMLDVPKKPSESKYSPDRYQSDNSVKKKNHLSRSSKKTESKKAPPSVPTRPRASSKPQPIPRGNAFKNQNIQTKRKINLSDLNKQMLVNAAKVEAGELEFVVKKKAGATNPFSHPRPTKRQYLTHSTNRVRHRYVTKQMPFHIGTNEIRQFQLAFYQLFRTEIEKALHSIPAGTRMISVRPYDLNADEPHYRTGFQTPQHRFMVALLSRLNDHQPSSRNPSHTQLDLRFSPVRSCVYAATVNPHQVISELATYLPCASTTESLVALRKKMYPLHTRGRCRIHCQHSRVGYAQYQRECYSKEDLKHLVARDCGPPLLTEVNHPHWPTGGSEKLYERRVAVETTVTDRHQYPFTYQHPFHPLQQQPYRRLVVSAAINGPERQVGHRLFSELMLPCVEIEYELVTPPSIVYGQFKSKEFRTQLHQAQQAARESHMTRRHSFKNEPRSRLQSKCDPRNQNSTRDEFYYDYEPDESLYRPGPWSQYCSCSYGLYNESNPSINERVRTFLERTDQLFCRPGTAS